MPAISYLLGYLLLEVSKSLQKVSKIFTITIIIIFSTTITMISIRADMKDSGSSCSAAAPAELDQTFGRQCLEVLIGISMIRMSSMRLADYQET